MIVKRIDTDIFEVYGFTFRAHTFEDAVHIAIVHLRNKILMHNFGFHENAIEKVGVLAILKVEKKIVRDALQELLGNNDPMAIKTRRILELLQ